MPDNGELPWAAAGLQDRLGGRHASARDSLEADIEAGVSPEETAAIRDLFLPEPGELPAMPEAVSEDEPAVNWRLPRGPMEMDPAVGQRGESAPTPGYHPSQTPTARPADPLAASSERPAPTEQQPSAEAPQDRFLGGDPLLEKMVGAVGHRLNNHLASVVGNAAFLGERVAADPALRRAARDLQRSAQKVGEMVAEAVACAGVGRDLEGPTDLLSLLASMRPLIQAPLPSGVVLELQLPDSLPTVDAAPLMVRQAILRLAMISALPDGRGPGLVTVGARGEWSQDGRPLAVVLTLTSEGPAPESVRAPGGLQVPGAELWFAPDGRRWSLRWPASRGALPAQAPSPTRRRLRAAREGHAEETAAAAGPVVDRSHGALAGRTILVVDDDPDVRSAVRRLLTSMGARVEEAEDGFSALSVLQEPGLVLDLVLLDLVMPGLDGDEVLRSMRRMGLHTPVILMTGSLAAGAKVQEAYDRDVNLMVKPFDQPLLLANLEEVGLLGGFTGDATEATELLPFQPDWDRPADS